MRGDYSVSFESFCPLDLRERNTHRFGSGEKEPLWSNKKRHSKKQHALHFKNMAEELLLAPHTYSDLMMRRDLGVHGHEGEARRPRE